MTRVRVVLRHLHLSPLSRDCSLRRDSKFCREDGTALVMIVGYAVIALLLVSVVINAATAFQTRGSLYSWADGAAVAATQSTNQNVVYQRGLGESLPVDPGVARDAVIDYVRANHLADKFDGFTVIAVRVSPDGSAVSVTFGAQSPIVLARIVAASFGDAVPVTATAQARGPLS